MIALKSVQLNSTRLYNYGENQLKLQFLPSLIAYLLGFILVISFVFYFNLLGLALPNTNSNNQAPESFINVSKSLATGQINPTEGNFQKIIQTIDYLDSEEKCVFVNQKPTAQNVLFDSNDGSFWTPENCKSNVVFLQVVKLNPENLVAITDKPNLEQLLVSNNIYLLVYKNSGEISNLNFTPYLSNLAQFAFPSEISFIEATSYDASLVDNLRFYMVGSCQDFVANNCQLWQLNNTDNTRKIIFSDFSSLLNKYKLPTNTVVKFAKIQDSTPEAVNLILNKESGKTIILTRISTTTGLPIQEIEITKNNQLSNWNKYYR